MVDFVLHSALCFNQAKFLQKLVTVKQYCLFSVELVSLSPSTEK